MEHVGRMENQILFSLHSENHNHVKRTQYTTIKPIQGVCDEFHEYAIEWTPEYIDFYVDGISCAKFSITDDAADKSDLSWPFNKPFFLILNIAVGGGLGGPVEDDTLPYVMAIDYVRVYRITNQ
jgi:beta-glucanase (GH16 family)